MKIEKIFNQITNEQKSDFLLELLQKDETVKKAFLQFCKLEDNETVNITTSYEDFITEINDVFEVYKEEFELIDLEDMDWEDYTPRHNGYIPEWEVRQHSAEDKIEEIFDSWNINIDTYLIKQEFEKIFINIVGFYHACKNSDINDPYDDLGGDTNEHLIKCFKKDLKNISEKISIAFLNEVRIISSIENFMKYCHENIFIDSKIKKEIENFFIDISTKRENVADAINKSMIKFNIASDLLPSLYINSKTQCGSNWTDEAEKMMHLDKDIIMKLLEHYFETSKPDFIRIAETAIDKNKNHFSKYLYNKISKSENNNLFKKIISNLFLIERKFSYYIEIKDLLSLDEKNKIIDDIEYNTSLIIEVLNVEKQFDRILQFARSKEYNYSEVAKVITPIINHYPEQCFEILKTKILNEFATRNRAMYDYIGEWLSLAIQIPKKYNDAHQLAKQLYDHRPALPSLRKILVSKKLV